MKNLTDTHKSRNNKAVTEKGHILIIDDEAVIRDGCNKILKKDGWDVSSAVKGKDGLDLIKNQDFDIILLDLMMPGMSGLEVLTEVKRIKPQIYVIVITGYATIDTAVEAMKKGAFDYISKPFTPDQLRMNVKKALENKTLKLEAEFLRKEQEKGLQAIAQEQSKLKTILDCMPDGVLVVDGDCRVALYNPMAGKLLNISGENSLGARIDDCIDCKKLSDIVIDISGEKNIDDSRIAVEIDENGKVPLMAHIAPVTMDDGDVIGSVAIIKDISSQKSIDRMKADFIAKVTHELKTPAATINQLLMTLQSGVVGDLEEDQMKMIERAKQWGEGLLELVSDLLDISKFESGLAIQKLVSLEIAEVIEGIIDLIKPQAEKKNISITASLDENLPVINADRTGMKDIFTNLISNAVKYSEEGKHVEITGGTDRDYLKISVSDNGMGIAEKDIPFLFDRFFRVKNPKTRFILGTGLGLPIVKEIIEAHNGFIEVTTEEGKGSTFSVFLPKKID